MTGTKTANILYYPLSVPHAFPTGDFANPF